MCGEDVMITGLNHITLAVKDIDVSFRFYKDVLGFTPICKWQGSAYFVVGDVNDTNALWFCLDYDRKQLRAPSPCSTHYAFSISADDFDKMSVRIIESGAMLFKENTSPGESLYFLDPDGHKLEIHVGDWRTRVTTKKENPESWEAVEWFV